MKKIVLSSYLDREIARCIEEREKGNRNAMEQHESLLARRAKFRHETVTLAKRAWRNGNPIALLRHGCHLAFQSVSNDPPPPNELLPTPLEQRLLAGKDGECRTLDALGEVLDDRWTALVGYIASSGEVKRGDIDITLVGPSGVYAIEVKCFNAKLCCNGDRWWNSRGSEPFPLLSEVTRRPMSPSRQLNVNLSPLRNYLRMSEDFDDIRTIVVFAHKSSELGEIRNSTVDAVVVLRDWDISAWFQNFKEHLTSRRTNQLIHRIQASNKFHQERASVASPVREDQSAAEVVVRLPTRVFKQQQRRALERDNERWSSIGPPDLMHLWRSRELSETNKWIWQAGAFNHLTDKPALLKRRRWWSRN